MDLAQYQILTGINCVGSAQARTNAALVKAQSILETMLGYTLDPDSVDENLYNELGKTQAECSCLSVDTEALDDPDDVLYAYRLYDYNWKDKYFHVDPFKTVDEDGNNLPIKVKLVRNNITIKTFEDDEIRVNYGRDAIARYIEPCQGCFCTCRCDNCIQLAVDATWLWEDVEDIPTDLQLVWADMATYYANNKRDIKSETIGPHSYTRFDKIPAEDEVHNRAVIVRYAGPYGSVSRTLTI